MPAAYLTTVARPLLEWNTVKITPFMQVICSKKPDKRLSNVDPSNHDGAAVLLGEGALARLGSRGLHIIYSHLHLEHLKS